MPSLIYSNERLKNVKYISFEILHSAQKLLLWESDNGYINVLKYFQLLTGVKPATSCAVANFSKTAKNLSLLRTYLQEQSPNHLGDGIYTYYGICKQQHTQIMQSNYETFSYSPGRLRLKACGFSNKSSHPIVKCPNGNLFDNVNAPWETELNC